MQGIVIDSSVFSWREGDFSMLSEKADTQLKGHFFSPIVHIC